MPFKSVAQQKFMFSEHPEIARKWAAMTKFRNLPQQVGHPDEATDSNAAPDAARDVAQGEAPDAGQDRLAAKRKAYAKLMGGAHRASGG